MIVYKKTDEWYIEWQRMTASDNKWQRVTTSENEWQRVRASDNEWKRETKNYNEWQPMAARDKTNEYQGE